MNIVDGLPGHSHVGQASADDETDVTLDESASRSQTVWRPTVRHHDETAVILTAIQAGIENLIALQAEKYKPHYIPAPLTAMDRARTRARAAKSARIRELFRPREEG